MSSSKQFVRNRATLSSCVITVSLKSYLPSRQEQPTLLNASLSRTSTTQSSWKSEIKTLLTTLKTHSPSMSWKRNMWWRSTKQAVVTKASKATACATARASSSTRMEGTMRDSGKTTKWTATASSTTREENWHTKDTGSRISSTDRARSTTTIQ